MEIYIDKTRLEKENLLKKQTAIDEIVNMAKKSASNLETSFIYDYSKFESSSFNMAHVNSAVKELTNNTVKVAYRGWNQNKLTVKFYIKIK